MKYFVEYLDIDISPQAWKKPRRKDYYETFH